MLPFTDWLFTTTFIPWDILWAMLIGDGDSFSGTLVCPKCSDYCGAENCDPSQKSSAEELASLMEDIDEDACFGETVSNGIRSFLQNFGLSLGG